MENDSLRCARCGKSLIDDPPEHRSDKAVRLSLETYQALDFYRLKGESFNQTLHRLLSVIELATTLSSRVEELVKKKEG